MLLNYHTLVGKMEVNFLKTVVISFIGSLLTKIILHKYFYIPYRRNHNTTMERVMCYNKNDSQNTGCSPQTKQTAITHKIPW